MTEQIFNKSITLTCLSQRIPEINLMTNLLAKTISISFKCSISEPRVEEYIDGSVWKKTASVIDVTIDYMADVSYQGCYHKGAVLLVKDDASSKDSGNELKCDFCGEPMRNGFFVLLDSHKEFGVMRYDHACAEKFLGKDVIALFNLMSFIQFTNAYRDHTAYHYYLSLESVVTYSLFSIRKYGYVPIDKSGLLAGSTVQDVRDMIYSDSTIYSAKDKHEADCLKGMAQDIIKTWRAIDPAGVQKLNTFERKVFDLMRLDYISPRDMDTIAAACKNAFKVTSEYIGEIGKWAEADVMCIATRNYHGPYGKYLITIITTDSGATLIYKGNKEIDSNATRISFKVKSHDVYRGVKQTSINYVKVLATK